MDTYPRQPGGVARLTHSGYRVIIAANQSGIGRGLLDMATYNAINDKMYKAVNQASGVLMLYLCPHSSTDKCSCKPATGLFDEICSYGVNLSNVPAIGDSLKDLQAAVAAGAIPILVLTGKGQTTRTEKEMPAHTQIFENLAMAVDALVAQA